MKVAIPTYHRHTTINKQALHFACNELLVKNEDIYLFVSNMEEHTRYASVVNKGINIICANTESAKDKFNYIHQYFENGTKVLLIEDDVAGIITIIDKKPKSIIESGFKLMEKCNKKIWGVYPSANKLFMQTSSLIGFGFIVANIYGFVSCDDERLLVSEECKTDYERSVLYSIYADGVVRLNYVSAKTKNYTNKGGMQLLQDRAKLEEQSCNNLVTRFPSYIGFKNGTKSIYKEIKLLR
jgi:hypothetical protein